MSVVWSAKLKNLDFLCTVHFGLTCNWKFHNIGCVISQCGLKGFFALFWCDHVLRLVFIVKLPFCTLSTLARTVWLAGAGWLWATSIHTLYLNEGVERAWQWGESLSEVILQKLPQNLKDMPELFFSLAFLGFLVMSLIKSWTFHISYVSFYSLIDKTEAKLWSSRVTSLVTVL